MPTIPDDPFEPERRRRAAARPRTHTGTRARDALTTAWPLVLLAVVLALGAWRVGGDEAGTTRSGDGPREHLQLRSFGPARLSVPRGWVTLDRSRHHVTWGNGQRTHTVTLAHTEASVLPLPGVVQAMVEQSRRDLPGAELVESPRAVELTGPAARGDSAMLARFRVAAAGGRDLEVAQAWRRDSRAGLDLVATWTSSDGTWPVPPRSGIPLGEGSG